MALKTNKNTLNRLIKEMKKTLSTASDIYIDGIKKLTPVDSGKLKASIKIDKSDIDNLKVRIGTEVKYASAVEFGTSKQSAQPYFRPAIKGNKNRVKRAIDRS